MPEELDTSSLSIDEAFDKGIENTPIDPSEDASDNDQPDGEEKSDNPIEDKEDEQTKKDEDKNEDEGNKKEEVDEGKKQTDPPPKKEEYTKERFDGLMSAWQKDRTAAERVPELERQISELQSLVSDPNRLREHINKANPDAKEKEIELPPELEGADESVISGYKLMMKGVEKQIGSKIVTPEQVQKMVFDILNKPVVEQQKQDTMVMREVEEMSVKYGKEFIDNKKAIVDIAIEKKLPLGSLEIAYEWWKERQERSLGQKALKEVHEEKAREASIPSSGPGRSDTIPHFDPDRDGNKSTDEIWDIAKDSL